MPSMFWLPAPGLIVKLYDGHFSPQQAVLLEGNQQVEKNSCRCKRWKMNSPSSWCKIISGNVVEEASVFHLSYKATFQAADCEHLNWLHPFQDLYPTGKRHNRVSTRSASSTTSSLEDFPGLLWLVYLTSQLDSSSLPGTPGKLHIHDNPWQRFAPVHFPPWGKYLLLLILSLAPGVFAWCFSSLISCADRVQHCLGRKVSHLWIIHNTPQSISWCPPFMLSNQ